MFPHIMYKKLGFIFLVFLHHLPPNLSNPGENILEVAEDDLENRFLFSWGENSDCL